MIILSICISTYNRSEKVYNLVKEILRFKSHEIEVCVSDNCSTDNTKYELSKIVDYRFHYFENENNIGAIQNYLKAMSQGTGKYILFFTDKDSINSSAIKDLICFLKCNETVVAGYCNLDIYMKKDNVILRRGIESLVNMGYLSRHPTGYFFQGNILNNMRITTNYSHINKVGSFPFEFILSEFCLKGETAILNIPLCYMETMDEVKKIKSYSYSETCNNLYFFPYQRFIMFEKYLSHLKTLNLSQNEILIVVKRLYANSLNCATFEYKKMVENLIVCEHYNIANRNISILEILKIDFRFSIEFLTKIKYENYLIRVYICLSAHFDFLKKKVVRYLFKK